MPRRSAAVLRAAAVLALALTAGGCEWFRTMSDPADIQPHERAPWPPAPNSIPLNGDPAYDLTTIDGVGIANPRAASAASIAAGADWYRVYCSVCHGPGGQGDGSISGIYPAIPPIDTPAVAGRSDAYIYALITQGRGLMPEYSRIPPGARWNIVNFVRSLPTRADVAPAAGTAAPAAAAPADTTGGTP